MNIYIYGRFSVELRSARDVASDDGLCGGRLSVHAFISGIWHGHGHGHARTEPKINKWANAGRTDERTNGQTDAWTNGRASKLDSTGALITVMASALSTDTVSQSAFVSVNVSVAAAFVSTLGFLIFFSLSPKRGWLTGDGMAVAVAVPVALALAPSYLLLPFD